MKSILLSLVFTVLALNSFAAEKAAVKNTEVIHVQVTEKGFEPAEINVKSGTHVILKVTRKTDETCAMDVVIKEKNIKQALPLDKEITVDVGTVKKGQTKFSCAMDMITGHIISK